MLEMLARGADGSDRLEVARRHAQLGTAYDELHRTEKAARHFRLSVEADPDNLDAALGLCSTLMTEAQAGEETGAEGAAELWKEVDKRYREVLARHRTGLADGQVADIWHRLGLAARALGDDKKAENALRRALERDPMHEATLAALVDLAGQKGDWKTVVEAKRAQLEAAPETLKVKLYDEIGDIQRGKLKDASAAVGAYLEALGLQPGSHVLLHKLLDAYTEQKQWRRAVETLDALAGQDSAGERRARYHYAAAVIARDELKDTDLAVERFSAALDEVPTTPKAFEAIDKLLTDRDDWKNLARAYRKQLKRLGEDADAGRLLELWTRLGDVCLDHLGDTEAAIAAFEVAADLAPDDVARHEQLADLYLEAGEDRRPDAIEELQVLLAAAPDRVELYTTLSELYRDEHELDKAWCLAQALVFLGAAGAGRDARSTRSTGAEQVPARDPAADRGAVAEGGHPPARGPRRSARSSRAPWARWPRPPPSRPRLSASTSAAGSTSTATAGRRCGSSSTPSGVLALDPPPMVWSVGAATASGSPTPSGSAPSRASWFRRSWSARPSWARPTSASSRSRSASGWPTSGPSGYVNLALGTLPKIENAFVAALVAADTPLTGHDGPVDPGDDAPPLRAGAQGRRAGRGPRPGRRARRQAGRAARQRPDPELAVGGRPDRQPGRRSSCATTSRPRPAWSRPRPR